MADMFSAFQQQRTRRTGSQAWSLLLHSAFVALVLWAPADAIRTGGPRRVARLIAPPVSDMQRPTEPPPKQVRVVRKVLVVPPPRPVAVVREQLIAPAIQVEASIPKPAAPAPLPQISAPPPPAAIPPGRFEDPRIQAAPARRQVETGVFRAATEGRSAAPPSRMETGLFSTTQSTAAQGTRVVAVSAGFSSVASSSQAPRSATTVSGAFGEVRANSPAAVTRDIDRPQRTPIQILSKPRPAYTDEARRRQIEGDVLLEALFAASGQIEVRGVLRSLGYGLDEQAIAAVHNVRFHPALEQGRPVDAIATIRIEFQLAY